MTRCQGPDSKSGSQMATAFSSRQLYRPGPKTQSADHSLQLLYIPIWNSLPPSVLRELSLKQLQRFKSEAYKYFLKNNWISVGNPSLPLAHLLIMNS